ncbi:type I-C CRISPR-associated protein Cas8c/Csd1 [Streptococcus constellatus]|uniref:CRISPR-associated protein Csd1 n=1 Tax=Streptococcus constellatus TaxID=76860 RepID=A0A0C1K5R1_STRCV|nr:type I-C CRISPR-associated protein Cas8c/Csd1 [Streptococcus constellatus]KIC78181.1 CRISPR-associated protein Csd1 [Streptococcus constellatus]
MDFFTSLLKTYEKAEEIGLVDQQNGDNPVLLPLYHTSLKSNGKNIIAVKLDQDGSFYKAEVMDDNQTIIFPVTGDSVARSGSNPAPHPLVDKFSYYVSEANQSQYDNFHEQLANWIAYCEEGKVKDFLMKIQHFILQTDFLSSILQSLYSEHYQREGLKITYSDSDEKNKTVDLSAYFLEFSIVQFHGFKDESVTSYKALHQSFISFMTANQDNLKTCNISGRMEQITNKHRGLMGNAKIISVSNKGEAYKGRFKEREDVFSVGYETSEKIHLMIKYLLENKNSSTWLGSSQYLINWFSDDLVNESQLDIVKPIFNDLFEDDEEESLVPIKPNEESRQIGSSFIKGQKLFGNDATYYIAILNKTSNGRIALKYFRQVQVSQLLKNLETWQEDHSWEAKTKSGNYKLRTPTFNEIINAAYGVDRERYLELDNDSFKSDQYQQLVTALIDGNPIPSTIVKKLEANIKQRQKYPKHWSQVQQISLAILHKQYRREFKPMLDHENTNRSYLFGRLLAIFELMESKKYEIENPNKDKKESNRITNAERYWNAYTSQPAKLMMNLTNKIKPYEEAVRLNAYGIFHKLDKERAEIVQLLSPQMAKKDINDPLDYQFIFGYYAEKQFFYTKQEKNESEE